GRAPGRAPGREPGTGAGAGHRDRAPGQAPGTGTGHPCSPPSAQGGGLSLPESCACELRPQLSGSHWIPGFLVGPSAANSANLLRSLGFAEWDLAFKKHKQRATIQQLRDLKAEQTQQQKPGESVAQPAWDGLC
ncbi:hypothetical protein DV515_00006440, partial [Chloebia gouldiae]